MTSPMCERSFESPSYGTSESESQISRYKQDTDFKSWSLVIVYIVQHVLF